MSRFQFRPEHYLLVVAVVTCAFLGIIGGLLIQQNNNGRLPPIPLTGNISFDEKLEWLWKRGPRNWDVLAAGSSMTLNNLYSEGVINELSAGTSYVNSASWSLKIGDTRKFVDYLCALQQPKSVIVICGPMDFYGKNSVEFIQTNNLNFYRATTNYGLLAAQYFDPIYYYKHSQEIREQRRTRASYRTLMFDSGGGVPMDVSYPSIDSERWNEKPRPELIDPAQYIEFERLAVMLEARQIRFICAQSPIRSDAYDASDTVALDRHWQRLSDILKAHGFPFYNIHRSLSLGPESFADYSHLNADGARQFTAALVEQARANIRSQ
ncbi:MAG: hypothetical protein H0W83_17875 [Planctomycetes bacterium]|nr:hypothetical protein [Planctomycetota bacterium]